MVAALLTRQGPQLWKQHVLSQMCEVTQKKTKHVGQRQPIAPRFPRY